jgi:hypothetical protein
MAVMTAITEPSTTFQFLEEKQAGALKNNMAGRKQQELGDCGRFRKSQMCKLDCRHPYTYSFSSYTLLCLQTEMHPNNDKCK